MPTKKIYILIYNDKERKRNKIIPKYNGKQIKF